MGDKFNLMHMYSNLLYIQILNYQICIILPVLIKSPSPCALPHTTTLTDLNLGMVENAGCGIRDMGCGIRGAGSVENAGSMVENAGLTVENAGSTVENAGSTVENAGSTVEKLVLILKIKC